MLKRLETLLLGGCKELEELPREVKQLVNLRMLVLTSKQKQLLDNGIGCLTSLRCLVIGSCCNLEKLFNDTDNLKSLRTLIIGNCPNLASLPQGVKNLSSLEKLMFFNSKKTSELESLLYQNNQHLRSLVPHLRMLCIDGFPNFQQLPPWLRDPDNVLDRLAIKNCPDFNELPMEPQKIFKSLQHLEISNCPKLSSLPKDMHLTALRELKVRNCPTLTKICKQGQVKIPRIELDGKVIDLKQLQ
ncbi:hypothetical protein Ddye_024313 [Dipteronia dyeriana]|uniref:Disease resistance R13L4/SHOC-2-like LRR domain-containing protein n=1 Tax=Dipteronia dyeriana TaxID=168575 RepID=A0AAD9TVH0_9ROSI|nr:hypothetical protein Ddye_024313 [Dipteronia dyeriana]